MNLLRSFRWGTAAGAARRRPAPQERSCESRHYFIEPGLFTNFVAGEAPDGWTHDPTPEHGDESNQNKGRRNHHNTKQSAAQRVPIRHRQPEGGEGGGIRGEAQRTLGQDRQAEAGDQQRGRRRSLGQGYGSRGIRGRDAGIFSSGRGTGPTGRTPSGVLGQKTTGGRLDRRFQGISFRICHGDEPKPW